MAVYPSGLGSDQQATQATAAMRQEPWYLQWLQQQGVTPGADQQVKLNDNQRAQLMDLAMQHGIGFNGKYDMIDENGQIAEEHHKLKKIAIAAAIAGAGLTGLGAAGIGPLAGALGGGASAATATGAVGADVAGAAALPASGVLAGLPGAMTALPAVAGAAGTTAGILGTGAKLASLAGGLSKLAGDTTGNGVTPQGSAYAAQAGQLAANRAAQARIDQGGPSADAQALRNQFRAALAARMDPSAAPLSLNGNTLPSLANADTVAAASKLRDTLAARTAAGKTATTFGVADPTPDELAAEAKARDAAGIGSGVNSTLSNVSNVLSTGSRLANLGKDAFGFGKQLASFFNG